MSRRCTRTSPRTTRPPPDCDAPTGTDGPGPERSRTRATQSSPMWWLSGSIVGQFDSVNHWKMSSRPGQTGAWRPLAPPGAPRGELCVALNHFPWSRPSPWVRLVRNLPITVGLPRLAAVNAQLQREVAARTAPLPGRVSHHRPQRGDPELDRARHGQSPGIGGARRPAAQPGPTRRYCCCAWRRGWGGGTSWWQ